MLQIISILEQSQIILCVKKAKLGLLCIFISLVGHICADAQIDSIVGEKFIECLLGKRQECPLPFFDSVQIRSTKDLFNIYHGEFEELTFLTHKLSWPYSGNRKMPSIQDQLPSECVEKWVLEYPEFVSEVMMKFVLDTDKGYFLSDLIFRPIGNCKIHVMEKAISEATKKPSRSDLLSGYSTLPQDLQEKMNFKMYKSATNALRKLVEQVIQNGQYVQYQILTNSKYTRFQLLYETDNHQYDWRYATVNFDLLDGNWVFTRCTLNTSNPFTEWGKKDWE